MLEKYVNWNLNAIIKYLYISWFSDFFHQSQDEQMEVLQKDRNAYHKVTICSIKSLYLDCIFFCLGVYLYHCLQINHFYM